MTDIVIETRQLRKVFRLYTSTRSRVLDSIGLLAASRNRYVEKIALDGIDLSINRGERVAIIGSNGAGKSTLLKILTHVLQPTSGTVHIRGETRALLQIGAGFHPELTGRENVRQYLAHVGLAGAGIERQIGDIVEFAEIAEYIDQPVKTYSTGMSMRLMFAASTVFWPEILIIDEVLGVGDAYFSYKSFERIRTMCARQSTTLLLVTHNIYDAERLCDRAIWLERGRVERDDAVGIVVSAYEARVRERVATQAELRSAMPVNPDNVEQPATLSGGLYWVRAPSPASPVLISEIRIVQRGEVIAKLEVCNDCEAGRISTSFSGDVGWGSEIIHDGRRGRAFRRYGSLHHRLPLTITDMPNLKSANGLTIEVDYRCEDGCELLLDVADRGRSFIATAHLNLSPANSWSVVSAQINAEKPGKPAPEEDRFGTREIEIVNVSFVGQTERADGFVEVGQQLTINLDYNINRDDFDEKPLIVFTVTLDGHNVCYIWNNNIRLRAEQNRSGRISVVTDPLLSGAGEYRVTCSLYKQGWLGAAAGSVYFAADRDIYDMIRRRFVLVVKGRQRGPNMLRDFLFQQPSVWHAPGLQVVDGDLVSGIEEK
jgi:homopolymeric O-antigen transport system ATP-binding protein